jgi:Icc-related predicted phosphoesterase
LTRIFFSTDVHGSDVVFRKFLNAGKFYKSDVIILGGDLTGKIIVPILEHSSGDYEAFLPDGPVVTSKGEIGEVEKRIKNAGFYSYFASATEMQELKANQTKLDALFFQLMQERIGEWVKLAEDNLKPTGIRCILMPGNDDHFEVDKVLDASDYVINPEGKTVQLDEFHEMISTGFSNVTPWKVARDISEEELAQKIEKMTGEVKSMKDAVFNFHCPPYDSKIDTAPELDATLKPKVESGGLRMIPVGSKAVRAAIEKYQPLLGLHGHIHESSGAAKIGRTLCLNPGSEYSGAILRGVILNLDKKGLKSYMFTTA